MQVGRIGQTAHDNQTAVSGQLNVSSKRPVGSGHHEVDEGHAELDKHRTTWRIVVKDNGNGFDPSFAEEIFAPIQRLHSRAEYEGTGMSLTICRRIVDRHSGSITVASAPGAGSTFSVTIPVAPPEDLSPAAKD